MCDESPCGLTKGFPLSNSARNLELLNSHPKKQKRTQYIKKRYSKQNIFINNPEIKNYSKNQNQNPIKTTKSIEKLFSQNKYITRCNTK
jgi:hypothetical protein